MELDRSGREESIKKVQQIREETSRRVLAKRASAAIINPVSANPEPTPEAEMVIRINSAGEAESMKKKKALIEARRKRR